MKPITFSEGLWSTFVTVFYFLAFSSISRSQSYRQLNGKFSKNCPSQGFIKSFISLQPLLIVLTFLHIILLRLIFLLDVSIVCYWVYRLLVDSILTWWWDRHIEVYCFNGKSSLPLLTRDSLGIRCISAFL